MTFSFWFCAKTVVYFRSFRWHQLSLALLIHSVLLLLSQPNKIPFYTILTGTGRAVVESTFTIIWIRKWIQFDTTLDWSIWKSKWKPTSSLHMLICNLFLSLTEFPNSIYYRLLNVYRCQFHKRFMISFYARWSRKHKKTLMTWLNFYAVGICVL